MESENERGGGVGGEGLDGEVYRVKELIVARGKVEVVEEDGCVCVLKKMRVSANSVHRCVNGWFGACAGVFFRRGAAVVGSAYCLRHMATLT